MTLAVPTCPVCHTLHIATDTFCRGCGLHFASYLSTAEVTRPPVVTTAPTMPSRRYTMQRVLSQGGMGALYLATDHHAFDRPVVIKAMRDYFDAANPQEAQAARDRFLDEARTLASLRHPAIPQIYAYFQDGPHAYIVMEYIAGRDLDHGLTRHDDATGQLLPGRAYPRDDVIAWGIALCKALEYLASRQPHPVVHHDIKPANLLLDQERGEIRLVDFGTAKACLLPSGGVGMRRSSLYGTQGYAAPEQYRGRSEPRSDVYALAATLYHLATDDDPGEHPFTFSRLDDLGDLGVALRAALDHDVTRRPTAAALRAQLQALLVPTGRRPLVAPNGSLLADTPALAAWCEQHWGAATAWFVHDLPDQIEVHWGETQFAQHMRSLARQHWPERGTMLDAALVLLDPAGFGNAQPQLVADTTKIDFGRLDVHSLTTRQLTVSNQGRRWASVEVLPASWLEIDTIRGSLPWAKDGARALSLAPGETVTLYVAADMRRVTSGGKLRYVLAFVERTALLVVEVKAEVSAWRVFWRSIAWLELLKVLALLMLPLICLWACVLFSIPQNW